jgi:hypothetical protein
LKNDKEPAEAAYRETPMIWSIWRGPEKMTEYKSLRGPEWLALQQMRQNTPFAQVCEELTAVLPTEEVAPTLYGYINDWLERGWITSAQG